jgi:diguanylate cyclase (GGDEF)-like protein/PAS domain S-box-containing protein
MNAASFLGLVQNTALLLAAACIFDVAASRWRTAGQSLFQQVPLGFAIGAIGITVMMTPWTFMPGIVFDTRSVLIGISGLFCGSFSAAIAVTMTAAFRIYQGGTGAWTGVAVILASGLIGIVWRHSRRRPLAEISWRELYLFGLVIHLAMLGLMFTLPWVTALRVLSSIALPVILIYPLGTALLGLLMVNRLRGERADDALRASEERYRRIVETSLEGIWIINEESRTTFVNQRLADMLGYAPEEMLGKQVDLFIFGEDLADFALKLDARRRGEGGVFERRFRRKDGTVLWNIVSATPLFDGAGRFTGSFSMFTDITVRKHAETAIQESRALLNSIIEGTTDAIYAKDLEGRYILFNAAAGRAVGKSAADVLGKDDRSLFPPSEAQIIMEGDRKVVEGRTVVTYETVLTVATGRKVTYLSTKGPLFDVNGNTTGLFGLTRDISERKHAEDALRESETRYRELSIIDGLTQLYNSRYFYQQLKMETERSDRYGQPLTLLLLDLDDFKKFNDAYGHVEGDQVLMRLGQVVKKCLRQTDSAYRYGGEEFTILLPMTTGRDCIVTAERIRAEFKKETFSPVAGRDVHLTVSIGVAQYKPQEDVKVFVHRVDQLMYQGKKNGKDTVCSEP